MTGDATTMTLRDASPLERTMNGVFGDDLVHVHVVGEHGNVGEQLALKGHADQQRIGTHPASSRS